MSKDFEQIESGVTVVYTTECRVRCELYLSEEISPSSFESMVEERKIILPNLLLDDDEGDTGIYIDDGDGNLELVGELVALDEDVEESVSVEF